MSRTKRLGAVLGAVAASALAGCAVHLAATPASRPTATTTLSPAQRQNLDDWRIRAGLYEANEQPTALPYVPDSGLGSWSHACQTTAESLVAYRPGLLHAPDPQLAAHAKASDAAVTRLLTACIHNDAVGLHHARGEMGVDVSAINVRYARLLGQDPSAYGTTKVL